VAALAISLAGQCWSERPRQNEIQLLGEVSVVDVVHDQFTMRAERFVVPTGGQGAIDPPKSKLVRVDKRTVIASSVEPDERVALKDLQPGTRVAVTGRDLGTGKPLPARLVVVESLVRSPSPGRGNRPSPPGARDAPTEELVVTPANRPERPPALPGPEPAPTKPVPGVAFTVTRAADGGRLTANGAKIAFLVGFDYADGAPRDLLLETTITGLDGKPVIAREDVISDALRRYRARGVSLVRPAAGEYTATFRLLGDGAESVREVRFAVKE